MASFPNRCQHIKINGTQCGCPALRRNKLCYFHKRHHDERVQLNSDRLKSARSRPATVDLPVLEDANSIQISLMQIMRLLLAGRIDPKIAGLMLYALQTASHNLSRTTFEPRMHNVVLDTRDVGATLLGENVWEDEDFEEEEDEEAEREAALAEATAKEERRAELDRWAEGEARRLAIKGARDREALRQAEAAQDARRKANAELAQRNAEAAQKSRPANWSKPIARVNHAEVTPAITTAPVEVAPVEAATPAASVRPTPLTEIQPQQSAPEKPAPARPPKPSRSQKSTRARQPKKKRPPIPATIAEAREQVQALIRKEYPAMLAVLQSHGSNGRSG